MSRQDKDFTACQVVLATYLAKVAKLYALTDDPHRLPEVKAGLDSLKNDIVHDLGRAFRYVPFPEQLEEGRE